MAVAAGLALGGGRFGRRAALRGVFAVAATSAVINGPTKWAFQRRRPPLLAVPLRRRAWRETRTSSFPSGHSASAAAFAVGVATEMPVMALPLGAAAAAVGYSRVHVGVHYPGDVVAGLALGAGLARATTRLWPVAPHAPAQTRPHLARGHEKPSADGAGVHIAVNPGAGPALVGGDMADQLMEALPGATIERVEEGADLVEMLERLAVGAKAIGVAGGDGSINAAAQVAVDTGLPLVAIPGGTLNHLARDLGLTGVDDAVEAIREGEAVTIDVATIADHVFLNTASFGAYVELVDARERLEGRIGKWPAMVVALVRVLAKSKPVQVRIDGVAKSVWMIFIGNCRYHPHGFAPSWRERLDDGLLDVRTVDGTAPWARLRLVLAVLSGRLGTCRVYEERLVREIEFESMEGPLRLARDGEVFDGPSRFAVRKLDRPLVVHVPAG
ncbi:MAG TPA: phosphatase PAP2 family protein [Mycobacteriales bacterium]|nr:phosphatase PAP2 family protein [Mycobacteriales bacterium]